MATQTGSIDLKGITSAYSDQQQYFWVESSSSATWGGGAHITNVAESAFKTAAGTWGTDPTAGGYNLLMNTDTANATGSLQLRNGSLPIMNLDNDSLDFNTIDITGGTYTTVASFGGDGSQIGKTGESRLNMDYHSMKFTDNNDYIYFHVSDLRSPHTATDEFGEGFYYVDTVEYVGTGTRVGFSIPVTPRDTNYSVKVDGVELTSGVTKRLYECVIRPAPAEGAVVTITYPVTSRVAKAYTLGMRKNNARVGAMSVAEGLDTTASGNYSHAEGRDTVAGLYCHAEGYETSATRGCSHAEGQKTVASGTDSHAEGCLTTSSGARAHAEGYDTQANGDYSHAEGYDTQANGDYSHAQNLYTVATENYQTVIGKFNAATVGGTGTDEDPYTYSDVGNYAFIIGNGTDNTTADRSNAFTVDWDGNVNIPSGASYQINGVPIADYIVDQGTTGKWYYEKYESGLVKGWYFDDNTTTTLTTSSGNGWYRNASPYSISMSGLGIVGMPQYVSITVNCGYAHVLATVVALTNTTIQYYVSHLGTYSNRTSDIHATVVGRWK